MREETQLREKSEARNMELRRRLRDAKVETTASKTAETKPDSSVNEGAQADTSGSKAPRKNSLGGTTPKKTTPAPPATGTPSKSQDKIASKAPARKVTGGPNASPAPTPTTRAA